MENFQLPFKKGLVFLCALLFSSAQYLFAQTTVTIGPGANWTDNLLNSGNPNYNYATYGNFAATAWSNAGATYFRTLVKFNLSAIPAGASIQSAKLYLYSNPTVTSSSAWNGNSQLSGSNAVYFEKVTANWSETSVTWNNQPATTTTGRIWFRASTSTTENIQVDIKTFVQGWVNNPSSNYGMKMRLENEAYYRSRTYASENHTTTSIRPKLVISYTVPVTADPNGCATPDPSEEEYTSIPWYGDESFLNNYYDSLEQAQNNQQSPVARMQASDIETPWLRVPIRLWIY